MKTENIFDRMWFYQIEKAGQSIARRLLSLKRKALQRSIVEGASETAGCFSKIKKSYSIYTIANLQIFLIMEQISKQIDQFQPFGK